MRQNHPHTVLLLLAGSLLAVTSTAQQQGKPIPLGTVQGTAAREQMWRPPTAEEWKKPVLIRFQRTWNDAVAVSRETGKPILVCVNMDGEIASEHYAGVRYRSPEIAKIYEPYVCVIASVYRHNATDYDKDGNRILCPRFGSVTCGEHIWIEPVLFGKFFDRTRVAPRHIMVELDGKETYDVYYAWDTRSVFDTIQKGILERRKEMARQVRRPPERSLLDQVASRDIDDREAVESAYRQGDNKLKTELLQRAIAAPRSEPLDLLRLAIFDIDSKLNAMAREALKQSDAEGAVDLINEALRVPLEAKDRGELIAALERLGQRFPRAKKLAIVHRGLAKDSKSIDAESWAQAFAKAKVTERPEWNTLESKLEYTSAATQAKPGDAATRLELAEASLALAIDPKTMKILAHSRKSGSKYAHLMLLDAQRAGQQAEKLGAKGWRLDSVLAVASYYLGDTLRAYAHAERAVPLLPKGEQSWNAMATLGIFAEARMAAIHRAERSKKEWPGQWLTDVHAAYAVLSRHPLGTDAQVVAHYDFLRSLSAFGQAQSVLDAGLKRYPDSGLLHDRLRTRVLHESGPKGLESTYAKMLAAEGASKNLPWFAGYAAIVAAEFHRRAGDDPAARAAYDRAVALFDSAIQANPDSKSTADHFAALAIAGRARMALEGKQLELAVDQLLASFSRKPEAGGTQDGLNQTPIDTARLLKTALTHAKQTELLGRLDRAIEALPPVAFVKPDYERFALPSAVWRNGKLRRPGWRDRSEARERRTLEEAKRRQAEQRR